MAAGTDKMSKYNPSYKRPMIFITCRCGNTRVIRRSSFGKIQLCASCAKKQGQEKSRSVRASSDAVKSENDAWSTYRDNARRRRLDFRLTKQEFLGIRNQPCRYCGESAPSGLDRINNIEGYFKENVAPCCSRCNYAKRDQNMTDFIRWVKRIYEHQSILQ